MTPVRNPAPDRRGTPEASAPRDLVNTPSKRHCPASFWNLGRPAPTVNRRAPTLRRWIATRDALAAELGGEPPAEPPGARFDPVQAAIVAAQIKKAGPRLPSPERGEVDLDWQQLSTPVGADELEVFFQFARRTPGGPLEMYKLKTARISEEVEFAASDEEIAAVVVDPRFPDGMEAYELRTADGELIRLEMAPDRARRILADLGRDHRRMLRSDRRQLVAGPHCPTCEVAEVCPTFPAIDPAGGEMPGPARRLPSAVRLKVSKSRLAEMDLCERRAAWKAVFFIPPDADHQSRGTSPGVEVGNRFHTLMAEALLSPDPDSFFSGDPEMDALYRRHLALPCTAGLRLTAAEFPLGFTVRFRTREGSVSVVMYGLADAVGREADGTPAVIDHKTGLAPRSHPHEVELYGLGALLRIRDASSVATHIHWLSTAGTPPVCDRKVWRRDQAKDLAARFARLAGTVASWDLADAASPPYRVGEWCRSCPFEQRCAAHR